MLELLHTPLPWIGLALLVFGLAPGVILRLIVLAFRGDDPRRAELLGELRHVPRLDRPFWVVEQLEVAFFEGAWPRIRVRVGTRPYHLSFGPLGGVDPSFSPRIVSGREFRRLVRSGAVAVVPRPERMGTETLLEWMVRQHQAGKIPVISGRMMTKEWREFETAVETLQKPRVTPAHGEATEFGLTDGSGEDEVSPT